VEKLHIDPPSPVLLQMEDMLKDIMMQISGITPEMMGQEIDDKAGIISMIRASASITRLQTLFDQFDEFQRLDGDMTIEIIQKNFTYGKVQQIIGEPPSEEFDSKLFFKYNCKVAPGVLTESQQMLEAQQLIYARETLQIPISSKRILMKMNIQDKDEIIKEIEQAEQQQQQMEQQRAQLEMQQMQVDNQTKISYAHSQDGLAAERIAKIESDKAVNAEKISESQAQKNMALLNFLKAIKELQGIDLSHIEQSVNILNMLKPQEQVNQQQPTQEAI
jgi:hypothetical protein